MPMTRSSRPLVIDVPVPAPDSSYPVIVGEGVLQRLGSEVQRALPRARRVALLSDETVARLHGAAARAALEGVGLEVVEAAMPPGEAHKTTEQLVAWIEALVEGGLSRNDAVVALGGGVVTDVAGLTAALFMRGIALLSCPTTLLAQVDASVGGKVAVDLPRGKNLLGTFHFPAAVLIDPCVLTTLPDDELACGLAEMLKHGLLFSKDHFEMLQASASAIFERRMDTLSTSIATSVTLKAACVSRDPLEKSGAGKGRVLLNLGHTVAHALETVSDYGLRHGEAVALGLRAAARISSRKGLASPALEAELVEALTRLRLPTDLDAWLADDKIAAMQRALGNDKKRAADTLTYIALKDVADPVTLGMTPREIVELLRA